MVKFASAFVFLFALNVVGAEQIQFSMDDVQIKSFRSQPGGFSQIQIQGFENSKRVGTPELPVQSSLVVGTPADIQAQIRVLSKSRLENLKPRPVQPQINRSGLQQDLPFTMDEASYQASPHSYSVTYLGAFRGTPISRLDVPLAQYTARSNGIEFFNTIEVEHNTVAYSLERAENYTDYVIIAPSSLMDGVTEFAAWKKSQGYNVVLEEVLTPQLTLKGIGDLIAAHYKNGADFVLLIGDQNTIPMHSAKTSDGATPSDLKYFTMDGANDNIPDMFYGRIPANTLLDVTVRLDKAIAFDQEAYKNTKGLKQMIGIASNEGWSPSDEEYIKTIEQTFASAYGFQSSHFYENNKNSNPTELNKSLSNGAAWLFYLGHGSGSSWPSMYQTYSTNHVNGVQNRDEVKPIIIDVACMNGKLLPGYLGTTFTNVLAGDAFGAAAYYGGTVNISWHPPAVMARGIASEHAQKNFRHLGEALLAGQLYLAANWNSENDVVDNFEWYHLQGDPSMVISH